MHFDENPVSRECEKKKKKEEKKAYGFQISLFYWFVLKWHQGSERVIYAKKRHPRTILRRQSATVNGDGVLCLFNQFPLPSGHCNAAQEKCFLFREGHYYDNRLEFQLLVYSQSPTFLKRTVIEWLLISFI